LIFDFSSAYPNPVFGFGLQNSNFKFDFQFSILIFKKGFQEPESKPGAWQHKARAWA
jgi:hypothetical protein